MSHADIMRYLVVSACLLTSMLTNGVAKASQPSYCTLPAKTGNCRAAMTRYYYNPSSQSCQSFIYGGCQGNENNFRTESLCRAACVCTQAANRGNRWGWACFSSRPYFYDVDNGQCKRFGYRGCNGNPNRFSNADQCSLACLTSQCFLPREVGLCRAAFGRFFYNTTSQKCESFLYGGCQGNLNRFDTVEECDRKCTTPIQNEANTNQNFEDTICLQEKKIGTCRAAFPRYFYNSKTNRCEFFYYGGCQGNENNFASKSACTSRCMRRRNRGKRATLGRMTREDCQLPPDQGNCRNFEKAFYFNSNTQKCEAFTYGGCLGNKNRFESVESCQAQCMPPGQNIKNSIIGGGLRGFRNAHTPKLASTLFGGSFPPLLSLSDDIRTTLTKPSSPGDGTDGATKNAAKSQEPALNHSQLFPKVRPVCKLPKDRGPCLGLMEAYYYNSGANECQKFMYGGCLGNGNRFPNKLWCELTCKQTMKQNQSSYPSVSSDCQLPPETGLCEGFFSRFFYNSRTV
ncbi:papilin-like [Aplysia californica]|uniref:Papilin-like n=1 Tax=Aplysia californica TaxID=6500 RepID=A0ABM1VYQ2_APLCA|nr:papilin-like [Aplysia californica]XP_035827545.1 papilin-like [Aplysia californica]